MKPVLVISLLLGFVHFTHARFVREPTVAQLFEMAPLAVTGEVISISPLGIETTLSYPTVRNVTFHWLRITCKVGAVIKGHFHQESIDVAMLAVKSGVLHFNPPLLLSPMKGHKYVMFLAPSTKTNVFVSVLAPYDEANAIFLLDRKAREYDFSGVISGVVSPDYLKQHAERRALVFSLLDEDGKLSQTGPTDVESRYKTQIEKQSKDFKDFTISLEWKIRTNAAGWDLEVPTATPE